MTSRDLPKGNIGDSAQNAPGELRYRSSNHVFDGAGENIQYHSDSESISSKKSRTRYINPAIYIEPVESTHSVTSLRADSCVDDVTPHPHGSYRSNSTPMLSGRASTTSSGSVKRKSCRLNGEEREDEWKEEVTPRNNLTYREDGADTFRLSVASVSTTTTAKEERERSERKKQEAFQQWLARKEQERREKARMEKLKRQSVAAPTPEQREESFRRWLERKRMQNERRKAEEIMRQFHDKERMQRERSKKERDKEEKLNEWIRKKEEEMKAMKTKEERRAARLAIEEERRRANGERAYRDWLRTSKHKPLPVPLNQGELKRRRAKILELSSPQAQAVPLNQGELGMRGSVSAMYINPVPWQSPT